ncbi:MAG: carbamoyltransferase HypF [Elusimicrobia bacterium]|nr:carbamoyltransferase HypF [Elusimicrobiota bacterium]
MENVQTIGSPQRSRIDVRGAVQGVGFRPFVFRLATGLGLSGWVKNTPSGVLIEAEGPPEKLESFLKGLHGEKPPSAVLQDCRSHLIPCQGSTEFEILASEPSGARTARVLPDIASCDECLQEVFDPSDRRYRYPFTNCTRCGPRFSIIEALPYDRANTTMKIFTMCADCRREYDDPRDRRFHAQPNACPACGPQAELWDQAGNALFVRDEAVREAAAALIRGRILAVKGLGGFHLLADARSDAAVQTLRERKRRNEKPLAVMFPSLDMARAHCELSPDEARLLASVQRPIVLLRRKRAAGLSRFVAPGNPTVGALLPYTPLHALLTDRLGFPVIATSGNLSEEPICTDEREALARLQDVADLFLVHNRPIARHVDDSVAQVVLGQPRLLRSARGYAPFPVALPNAGPSGLAVGGHMKNTVAVTVGDTVFVSQHIGDLETRESFGAFRKAEESLVRLYDADPRFVAGDMHPDYASTRHAARLGKPFFQAQHHHAHVAAGMAENGLDGTVLGVAWDGTGYGTDGTVWGGEFLLSTVRDFTRVASLHPFRLPGGELSVKEPRRTALGVLFELFGDALWDHVPPSLREAVSEPERRVFMSMVARGLNAPFTSSAGRLFDAVASLAGVRQRVGFEGQAAMELEFSADPSCEDAYPFPLAAGSPLRLDWKPMVSRILQDIGGGVPLGTLSAKFHNALAEGIVSVAKNAGEARVVLAGGCFQNRFLLERSVRRLREEGFEPFWNRLVPTNDGGIALGQAVIAAARLFQERGVSGCA